jgi:hypothetical protein
MSAPIKNSRCSSASAIRRRENTLDIVLETLAQRSNS